MRRRPFYRGWSLSRPGPADIDGVNNCAPLGDCSENSGLSARTGSAWPRIVRGDHGGSTVTVGGTQTVTGTGGNQVVSVQWTPTIAGEHKLVVRIQANNVVKEYQPKTVAVAGQPPIPGAGSSGF